MKEKELTSKELLVQKLGMEFDEVAPIFSEETLTSMTMSHVVGGQVKLILDVHFLDVL